MSAMINSTPILLTAGFTANWAVEYLGFNAGGYNAWDGTMILQPEVLQSGVFLQLSQLQLVQINSDTVQGDTPPANDTVELQIQVTNTGGSVGTPGSSACSFNLWVSTN